MNSIAAYAQSKRVPGTFEGEIPSPCVSICHMHLASGLCAGCARTLDEIATWSSMDRAQKQAVLVAVAKRRESASASANAKANTAQATDPHAASASL